jgi:hypothetical protein
LEQLGLLNIGQLAEVSGFSTHEELVGPFANRFVKVLIESGFSHAEALAGLKVLREAAVSIRDHYGGKLQLCLRSVGERFLAEIGESFPFSELKTEEAKHAFTLWLQNVAHLPLSLRDRSLVAMCQAEGIEVDDLLTAADELDLNLAFVDDMVHHWQAPRQEPVTGE